MKQVHLLWLSSVFSLACLLALVVREYRLLPDGSLHCYVFDVDQGDGMLLVSPSGKQIVIDGGPNMSLLEHLGTTLPFFDRTIELLILSHPDADHITALPEVLRRYEVETVLLTGTQHNSSRYKAFLAAIEDTTTQIIIADPSQDIAMGDGLTLDVIWPSADTFGSMPKDANNPSVVFRALFKEHSILFTGDIEKEAEQGILASGADIRADILKIPHHGSRTSSSTGFLLAVNPELALLSVGQDNQFGHPHGDVMQRYEQFGISVVSSAQKTLHIKLE